MPHNSNEKRFNFAGNLNTIVQFSKKKYPKKTGTKASFNIKPKILDHFEIYLSWLINGSYLICLCNNFYTDQNLKQF